MGPVHVKIAQWEDIRAFLDKVHASYAHLGLLPELMAPLSVSQLAHQVKLKPKRYSRFHDAQSYHELYREICGLHRSIDLCFVLAGDIQVVFRARSMHILSCRDLYFKVMKCVIEVSQQYHSLDSHFFSPGQKTCVECPQGTTSTDGSSECTPCASGRYYCQYLNDGLWLRIS